MDYLRISLSPPAPHLLPSDLQVWSVCQVLDGGLFGKRQQHLESQVQLLYTILPLAGRVYMSDSTSVKEYEHYNKTSWKEIRTWEEAVVYRGLWSDICALLVVVLLVFLFSISAADLHSIGGALGRMSVIATLAHSLFSPAICALALCAFVELRYATSGFVFFLGARRLLHFLA